MVKCTKYYTRRTFILKVFDFVTRALSLRNSFQNDEFRYHKNGLIGQIVLIVFCLAWSVGSVLLEGFWCVMVENIAEQPENLIWAFFLGIALFFVLVFGCRNYVVYSIIALKTFFMGKKAKKQEVNYFDNQVSVGGEDFSNYSKTNRTLDVIIGVLFILLVLVYLVAIFYLPYQIFFVPNKI